jgi:hypothetical protein
MTPRAHECLEKARTCDSLATQAKDPLVKAALREAARQWRERAKRQEQQFIAESDQQTWIPLSSEWVESGPNDQDESMPLRRRDANAKQLNVRMPPDELKSLDAWIKTQPAPRPTKAEAIRRLVEQALAGGAQPSQKRSKKSAAKAREMAGQAIDRLLGDAGSLPVDERERRKRRLTKVPSEFRELRGDLPKPKG